MTFAALLEKRIAVLDGAMGTMIQSYALTEEDFRGKAFSDHPQDVFGCHDLLCLTQPAVVVEIHRRFLEAGADVIETNTFNAQAISMADYGLTGAVSEINRAGAALARQAADAFTQAAPQRPRFVAGSIGPTNRTCSLSPDVNRPGFRAIHFDALTSAYREQVAGLLAGGVDLLLAETTFDTLNLKAALFAIEQCFAAGQRRVPVLASVTITDASGRTLSGQTLEAFWLSVSHAPLLAVGLNCALGAEQMRPHVQTLAEISDRYTACYPNAGLPNAFGQYDQTPEAMADVLCDYAAAGWLNIVGGCCGTRPEHVAAIAEAVSDLAPRRRSRCPTYLQLSGLEAHSLRPESNLIMVGERTNITGSRRFARLIRAGNYEAAVAIARDQVQGGANILDVNMDEGLIDSEEAMVTFLNLLAAEPDLAAVPVMIDSSRFSVIEAGLKCLQGKGIVNSISLKEGENLLMQQAAQIRRYGAAVVVMAFDETGQADTVPRRVAIAERAHRILTTAVGVPECDIIFDLNVLTVGTGIEAHNRYAVDFLEALRQVKAMFPQVTLSGGVSNVSFAFRGNETVREAMHTAFLYHARQAGLDMAIVNAGQLAVYEDLPAELRDHVEDVLLDRRPDATERLLAFAETVVRQGPRRQTDQRWREKPLTDRLTHALVHGIVDFLEQDLDEARAQIRPTLKIIEGPLMAAMNTVGDLFAAGKMFLPQVVKTARVMKKAVAILLPYLEHERSGTLAGKRARAKMVLATVKGDVHDIGKNIVAVVLRCNDYQVIDLGVMIPASQIVEAAKRERADLIGLSGLITPSLDEMVRVAQELQHAGLDMPLLIGGATTSRKHTAVKIAPCYRGPTIHVRDASRAAGVISALVSTEQRDDLLTKTAAEQAALRQAFQQTSDTALVPYAEAVDRKPAIDWDTTEIAVPAFLGTRVLDDVSLSDLLPYIDWTPFFQAWDLRGVYPAILDDPRQGPAARDLYAQAQVLLREIVSQRSLRAAGVYGFFAAASLGDDIVVYRDAQRAAERLRLHTLRQQRRGRAKPTCLALADFVAPHGSGREDFIGAFAVTAGLGTAALVTRFEAAHDDYQAILVKALADRLAEAFAEWLHQRVRREWGYGQEETLTIADLLKERYRGIRPAPGYPACPDHSEKRALFDLLDAPAVGLSLTETYAMHPPASVCGIYLAHPQASYFAVGRIGRDQLASVAARKEMSVEEAARWLGPNLSDVGDR